MNHWPILIYLKWPIVIYRLQIELHVLNGQCLNRHISAMEIIKEEVDAWKTHRNNKNSKINWQFTNKEARVKLKRLYPSIYD